MFSTSGHSLEQIPQLPMPYRKSWPHYLWEGLLAAGSALVLTGIIYAFHLYPTIPNISLIYLPLILLLASSRGRYTAIVTACIAFLSFDFFLVPPLYHFTIDRWEEWLALFVFLVAALLTSQLAANMRRSTEQAHLREREAWILFEVGRVLNQTKDLDEQLDSIALALVRVFSPWGVRECAILLPDTQGTLHMRADAPIRVEPFVLSPAELVAAQKVMLEGALKDLEQVHGSSEKQNLIFRLIPLKTAENVLGVLCLRIEPGISWFASEQRMREAQERPTEPEQALFFWTFLDEVVMKIEYARLHDPATPG